MKTIITCMLLITAFSMHSQENERNEWIRAICAEMIEANSLAPYRAVEIPDEVTVNYVLVDRCSVKSADESSFALMIDHGKGEYCTELVFSYIVRDGRFLIEFGETGTEKVFGRERKFIDPWQRKVSDCR